MMERRRSLQAMAALAAGMGCCPWLHADAAADANAEFFAAVMRDNYRGVLTQLLRGFNPNTPDARGRTGLTLAIRQESWRVVDELLQVPGIDLNLPNRQGETPLMLAAIKGNLELVKKLVKLDADVNREGWAPLHYAASAGLEHSVEIAAYLLEESAYIDAASPNGSTPLMLAAQYSSEAMVKLLIEEGADVSLRNQQGMTAVDFARKSEREYMVQLLSTTVRARRPGRGQW
ncbi:ankyrin repeat domain-containing protein [Comamonas sp. GB3 AK4-5]|uniref:ankyrin repeat domain-containing protein n=1 Tax=Comamonas sp. GB3 AK4-5 TaxID=3231487 RepID=UPI00351DC2E0